MLCPVSFPTKSTSKFRSPSESINLISADFSNAGSKQLSENMMFVKCVLYQPLPVEDLDSGAILIYCLSLVAGMSMGSN